MSVFVRLVTRDLSRALASGGIAMPVVFFLLVATLYPFAVGPDAALLGREVHRGAAHHLAVDADFAFADTLEAADAAQHRRLAAARRAEQAAHRAAGDGQIQGAEGGSFAVAVA